MSYINIFFTDVLGNLTSLIELDLSYNELSELPEPTHGPMFPTNLSQIWLSNNQLSTLPYSDLLKANPTLLDLRANALTEFAEELSYLVENGTQLLFSGIGQLTINVKLPHFHFVQCHFY
jgi:internalin A